MRLWEAISYPFRRGPRRPLASRQPAREAQSEIPLGMEAIDMDLIKSVNRRNAALERVNTFFAPKRNTGSHLERAETRVTPLPDDETYAAHFHRAYMKKDDRTDE